MIKRKDERGVMLIDREFVDLLKEKIKGKDAKGRFIKVNIKKKELKEDNSDKVLETKD